MNNKNKKRLGILLVIFGFILSGVSFAYWAGSITGTNKDHEVGTIIIGEGGEVATELTLNLVDVLPSGKVLVPENRTNQSNDPTNSVEEINFQISVLWKSSVDTTAVGTPGKVTLTHLGVKIGTATEYATGTLVVVTITNATNRDINADGDAVVFDVKVTLTEPTNLAAYNAIINEQIKLGFNAAVTVVTP